MRSSVGSYDLLEKLGQGSYGLVYKGRQRNSDNKLCVIKEINLRFMDPKERSDAVNEGQLLKSLNNQYIVKYYDMFIEEEDLFIAMEYCENGDLLQYLTKSANPLPENKIWQYFLQMLLGLDYMHSRRILHRDFKTMNMFLTNSCNEIRIGDLGVAKRLHSKSQLAKTIVGTPYFLSPEICEEKPYSEKSDVWSLGCIVYEMATLKHPFEANNHQALLLKILKNKPDSLPSTLSRELQTIVNLLLTKDQSKRPDTSALLKETIIQEKMNQLRITGIANHLASLTSKPGAKRNRASSHVNMEFIEEETHSKEYPQQQHDKTSKQQISKGSMKILGNPNNLHSSLTSLSQPFNGNNNKQSHRNSQIVTSINQSGQEDEHGRKNSTNRLTDNREKYRRELSQERNNYNSNISNNDELVKKSPQAMLMNKQSKNKKAADTLNSYYQQQNQSKQQVFSIERIPEEGQREIERATEYKRSGQSGGRSISKGKKKGLESQQQLVRQQQQQQLGQQMHSENKISSLGADTMLSPTQNQKKQIKRIGQRNREKRDGQTHLNDQEEYEDEENNINNNRSNSRDRRDIIAQSGGTRGMQQQLPEISHRMSGYNNLKQHTQQQYKHAQSIERELQSSHQQQQQQYSSNNSNNIVMTDTRHRVKNERSNSSGLAVWGNMSMPKDNNSNNSKYFSAAFPEQNNSKELQKNSEIILQKDQQRLLNKTRGTQEGLYYNIKGVGSGTNPINKYSSNYHQSQYNESNDEWMGQTKKKGVSWKEVKLPSIAAQTTTKAQQISSVEYVNEKDKKTKIKQHLLVNSATQFYNNNTNNNSIGRISYYQQQQLQEQSTMNGGNMLSSSKRGFRDYQSGIVPDDNDNNKNGQQIMKRSPVQQKLESLSSQAISRFQQHYRQAEENLAIVDSLNVQDSKHKQKKKGMQQQQDNTLSQNTNTGSQSSLKYVNINDKKQGGNSGGVYGSNNGSQNNIFNSKDIEELDHLFAVESNKISGNNNSNSIDVQNDGIVKRQQSLEGKSKQQMRTKRGVGVGEG